MPSRQARYSEALGSLPKYKYRPRAPLTDATHATKPYRVLATLTSTPNAFELILSILSRDILSDLVPSRSIAQLHLPCYNG